MVYGSDNDDSKFILKSLLNKILSRENDPIVIIEYKNPFDIEMQLNWHKEMPARLIYYHGGLLRESLREGEDYDKMRQTITICITDSTAFPESKKFLNEFYLIEKDEHFKLTDVTQICCIELPKVNSGDKSSEELSPLEICLEYLRCADENGSEYVDELIRRGGKDLEMAQEILRKATEEEILREKALAREKFLRDKLHAESYYDRGLNDGRAEGRAEALKEIAKNLKADGIPVDVIAKNTGLPEEEINNL